jgi:hypothetical protein
MKIQRYSLINNKLVVSIDPSAVWMQYSDHKIQIDKLRQALIGLVGAEEKDELESMEMVIRMSDAPAKDKANIIDAIHTLIETIE